jgi:hypothetical protein
LTVESLVSVIWETFNGSFAIVPEHVSPDRKGGEGVDGEWRMERGYHEENTPMVRPFATPYQGFLLAMLG